MGDLGTDEGDDTDRVRFREGATRRRRTTGDGCGCVCGRVWACRTWAGAGGDDERPLARRDRGRKEALLPCAAGRTPAGTETRGRTPHHS